MACNSALLFLVAIDVPPIQVNSGAKSIHGIDRSCRSSAPSELCWNQ
jgi:hypothetical protein